MIERCLCEFSQDPVCYFEPDDNVFRFDRSVDYGLLLVLAGVFKNVKQAHTAGFAGKVPVGWSEVRFNGFHIYILNRSY